MGIPEFASLAGISRNQAYALAANNLLGVRIIRFGKRLVIPRRAAMRFLSEGAYDDKQSYEQSGR